MVLESKLEEAVTFPDHEFLDKAVEPCARCIAIAILKDKEAIEGKTEKLVRRLMWEVSAKSLVDVFLKISVMNRVSDFTDITRYFLSRMAMMMNRRNLGQEEDGS